jgi:hypothetical protein
MATEATKDVTTAVSAALRTDVRLAPRRASPGSSRRKRSRKAFLGRPGIAHSSRRVN